MSFQSKIDLDRHFIQPSIKSSKIVLFEKHFDQKSNWAKISNKNQIWIKFQFKKFFDQKSSSRNFSIKIECLWNFDQKSSWVDIPTKIEFTKLCLSKISTKNRIWVIFRPKIELKWHFDLKSNSIILSTKNRFF